MARTTLTDRFIRSRKAARIGTRDDYFDAVVPGLALRVTDRGAKSYCLVARFPGSSNPTRRTIAPVGTVSLADARVRARKWLELIATGIDPGAEEERKRLEQ